jgi:hypothetical protein
MLVDGRAGLNLISVKLMEVLQISKRELTPTNAFRGAIPGATQPLGKVVLPVTSGKRDNFRMVNVMFDIAEIPLPYNGLLSRPALAQFMVAAHYAYNMIKIPATWGVLPFERTSGMQFSVLRKWTRRSRQENPATSVK